MKQVSFIVSICLLCISHNFAQVQTPRYNTPINSNINGFYEYLPQGYYDNPNEKFPVILFLIGNSERGNGTPGQLEWVLNNGTPMRINQGGFPTSFTVNGQTFKFIVITPQFIDIPPMSDVNDCLDYIMSHYKADKNRLYITGLSMGGGTCWGYCGESVNNANRIAAMVPVSGAWAVDGVNWVPFTNVSPKIAAANLPVLATHNDNDPYIPVALTNYYVDHINADPTPPTTLARRILFHPPVPIHDASWDSYKVDLNVSGIYDDSMGPGIKNVYEWFLRFRRFFDVVPVTLTSYTVSKNGNQSLLQWKTENEYNSKGFEIIRSTDNRNWEVIGFVKSTGASAYHFTDPRPAPGKNYYRINQVDFNLESKLSDTRLIDFSKNTSILIYPNPVQENLQLFTSQTLEAASLRIYNAQGQVIFKTIIQGEGTLRIPLPITKGYYVAEIINGTATTRIPFTKN